MIVVMNRVPVAEGYSDDFLERFRTRTGLVDGHSGFIRNLVLKPLNIHFIKLLNSDFSSNFFRNVVYIDNGIFGDLIHVSKCQFCIT